ncbi:hypothetical protein SteCoe_2179 [Stentor coeruleus]|uniref:Thioesterase domain-containing protein n=1 Tax=Stentor coeruleus TaxID=5963 RepID=A0A1R2CZW4_9CILI|nr:hypothetical protein SteCoe_2179 [Stentor coeruleus]
MILPKVIKFLDHFKLNDNAKFGSSLFKTSTVQSEIPGYPYPQIIFNTYIHSSFSNNYGFLHRGALCTIVDVLPALHIWSLDLSGKLTMTVSLSTSICKEIIIEKDLKILSSIQNIGKSLVYASTMLEQDGVYAGSTQQIYALVENRIEEFYKF